MDANIKIDELFDRILELGQKSIAITDHGNMYGAVEFYKKAKEKGVKPIIGCECYICSDVTIMSRENTMYHLILLAKNETGRQNLQKLVKESTKYKFNKRPRIDFEMLQNYHDGLICLSACMAGEVSRALTSGKLEVAMNIAKKYKDLFGDDYYIEYQAHEELEQQELNKKLVALANMLDIKYVVTCDSHYLTVEDQKYHSIFVKIGQTREVGEMYNDCYIQSEDDVKVKCQSTVEYNLTAIANTQEITDKCNVEYPLSAPIIPHTDIPKSYKSEKQYLQSLCNTGFKNKGFFDWSIEQWKQYMAQIIYDENGNETKREFVHFDTVEEIVKIYKDRARYEINAVLKMGFEGYYLLVHSYISSAERRGIARGSSGGSLLAYLSGIVDIDPIKYGLYFERFIDVGALDLLESNQITKKELKIPDVDADFSPKDRDKVMNHIIDTYGWENVVCLGLFQYIWAKGAIKDIGKVLGIPFEITNEMTKLLDNETIDEALENGVLDSYKDDYPELFEYASKLSGLPKSFGMHPCGKVICMKNADYYSALEYVPDKDVWVLQGDMHTADDLGLVKIDLLGLRTLDVIYDVLEMIGKDYEFIAPHKINLCDKEVWNEFRNGNSLLIFQFESQGMRQMLSDMKCNSIDNLSAANALYRPGAKAYIPNYIARKNGLELITYLHDDLILILEGTYGIIVYQEQLIEIGKLAGLRNPDELRQATAKKKPKLMAKIEPELKSGLMNLGWTKEQVDTLWDDILEFAKYSFNKSHSAAYALTAYITMYLKVHYPTEFITAYVNSYEGDTNKIAEVLDEAKRIGVVFKFDNWKLIKGKTTCKNGIVYLGINTLKGFGENVSNGLQEIGIQSCETFVDLIKLFGTCSDVDKSQFETMIKLDFFSEYGKAGKLLKIYTLYNDIYNAKVFNKAKLPIDENIIRKYARETTKQFRDIDNVGLFNELCSVIEDKGLSLKAKIKNKFEYQGIVDYVDSRLTDFAYVLKTNTKYSPKVKLYYLVSGETEVCKISKKNFTNNPVDVGDVIQMIDVRKKFKYEKVGEEFIQNTSAYDTWIEQYIIK
ncbi:DNA-directed DNA polymerase III PolC [Clostridium sp. ASBs410]|nr:DNA-directed DNA polymerase III PolC [Clostridium sp. ASBs410]